MKVHLSLGSNLGDRLANLNRALALLGRGGCRVLKRSSVYETAPLYYLRQPAFFNLAAACETALSPDGLLALIGRVESALKRRRLLRNGPRTIDVDILFYGGLSLSRPGLEIPHPRLAEREFVLAPLAEIAPGLRHPETGCTAKEMLARLKPGGARRLPADYAGLEAWLAALPAPAVSAHYSLANIRKALARLGSPEKRMGTVVHITGSTGKTSTAFMTAAALGACGARTGLYTSPHVRSLRERIKLDGRDIPEADLLRCVLRAESVSAGELSFFELLTAAAFIYFAQRRTRFAVVEVGVGGRLDSTNVVRGSVAAITSVSLEHSNLLGPRLADIAAHKAGIIKKGSAVVAGFDLPPAALRAILCRAAAAGAVVDLPGPLVASAGIEGRGAFQLRNAAFALKAASLAARKAGLKFSAVRAAAAFKKAVPPGRFEVLSVDGRRVIVDGAHNAEGVEALVKEFPGEPPVCVAAFMKDKDIPRLAALLAGASSKLILTRSRSYRSAAPAEVKRQLSAADRRKAVVANDPVKALKLALRLAGAGGTVLVAGSLYLAGDVLAALEGRRAFHPREMLVKF
jgi:dihydrofolate synthase/folylpolyglutamate synthase